MGTLTFGLVPGFLITASPFLLAKNGVSVDHIASVSAVASSPMFWAFLLMPIVDVGFTRRFYAFVFGLAAAAGLGTALWLFSPGRLWVFTTLLLLANVAIVLQAGAVQGWVSEFVHDEQRGKVGGWTNAANLGGGALGAMLVMWLADWLPLWAVGGAIALVVAGSTLVLVAFPAPLQPTIGLREIFGGTLRNVVRTSRQPNVLTGFLLFLAPVSCGAGIMLFAGLGKDFRADPQRVMWITGVGAALATSIGSVAAGYVADRVNRGLLYVSGGMLVGSCSVVLGCVGHTAAAFTVGTLVYNGLTGICYAAFTALSLELVGNGNPTASTQLALFAAASNAAISYMTWTDGQGYRLFGLRGLFLTDGLAALGAGIPLLIFLRWRARRATGAADGLADEA